MLAVSEAITNVVMYAYPGRRPGMARVVARLDASGDLKIAVADDGVGLTSAPSQGVGHGLTIIEKVADELNVVSAPDSGTKVEMTFRLADGQSADLPQEFSRPSGGYALPAFCDIGRRRE